MIILLYIAILAMSLWMLNEGLTENEDEIYRVWNLAKGIGGLMLGLILVLYSLFTFLSGLD